MIAVWPWLVGSPGGLVEDMKKECLRIGTGGNHVYKKIREYQVLAVAWRRLGVSGVYDRRAAQLVSTSSPATARNN